MGRKRGHRQDEGDQNRPVEQRQDVVVLGVVGENPPGRGGLERPTQSSFEQPFGDHLLRSHEPGTGGPVERPGGDAHETEDDQDRFPRLWCASGNVDDFVVGRAARQPYRPRKPVQRPHIWQSLAPRKVLSCTSGAQSPIPA